MRKIINIGGIANVLHTNFLRLKIRNLSTPSSETLSGSSYNLDNIKKLAHSAKNNDIHVQTTNTLSPETVGKTMEAVKTKLSLDSTDIAFILVTGLMQRGGSNQKAGNSVHFSFDGKTLSSQEFNKILISIQKGATNRQFARSICSDIIIIALEFEIPGDLSSQMKLEHPSLTISDSAWCSNFQTQNGNCPDLVRLWLVNNYKSRFNR